MIFVDLILIAAVAYAAYAGVRRGLVLVTLELISFALAAAIALVSYQSLGAWLRPVAGVTTALANVTAFMLIWVLVELLAALAIRFLVPPRLPRQFHGSRANRVGGAAVGSLKTLMILTIGLVIFAGLPLSAATKQPVTNAAIPHLLLASSGYLQSWLSRGLGRDLGESLNFFTVPSEPEDDRRIELGFTTTQITTAEADERAMLELINAERSQRGLPPLVQNGDARSVARSYSRLMLAEGFFSHRDNHNHTPFDRMRAGGVVFAAAGENLALAPTLQLAHQGLMNSPGHRANILSPVFRTVGIGIIDAGPYGLMVTQNFTD